MQKGENLDPGSKISSLAPFLDDFQLLRVGGRLSQSDYDEDKKHPILLNKNGHLTWLLIRQSHEDSLHSGVQQTLYQLQQPYWIINGCDKVRQYVRQCVKCFKFNSKPLIQQMGDLPEERIAPSRRFNFVGIDFAGPLLIKTRPNDTNKAYVALFICFTTRAIHLELVSKLSKDACIAAIKRFVSRRGLPNTMYSDNATNFIGSRNELLEIQRMLSSNDMQKDLNDYLANRGINWVTIPPRAPHFGGLWESGIKSMNQLLRRQMGNIQLHCEELTTLLCQIEAILNSRPLMSQSVDPNDLQVLTPGHFLIGAPLTAVPERSINAPDISLLKRWKLVQTLSQHFWKRWVKEFLLMYQIRAKWQQPSANLQIGDVVFVTDENRVPLQWPLGIITKVFKGNDDLVRVVELKFKNKIVTRPISKLRKLPIEK